MTKNFGLKIVSGLIFVLMVSGCTKIPIPMDAVKNNDVKTVMKAIEKGADVNAKDKDSMTALIWAAIKNSIEVAKLLIEKGADVNAKMEHDATALMGAAGSNSLEVAKLLIEKGADVNAKIDISDVVDGGLTVLMIAVGSDSLEIAKLLIEKGANVNAKDKKGGTALMGAKKKGHQQMVDLLKKHGAK